MAPPPLFEDCFLRLTKSQKVYRYNSAGDVDVGRDLRDLRQENNSKIKPVRYLMAPRLNLKIALAAPKGNKVYRYNRVEVVDDG
ncbi:MAG: hypothetical protein V3U71_13080 [Cocleimonas sp.]